MTINGIKLNTMFVERNDNGVITALYGSYFDQQQQTLVVVRSTKDMSNLAQQIYGDQYTNNGFIEKLKDRPYHNFIGQLSGPISMPISMEKVHFVD